MGTQKMTSTSPNHMGSHSRPLPRVRRILARILHGGSWVKLVQASVLRQVIGELLSQSLHFLLCKMGVDISGSEGKCEHYEKIDVKCPGQWLAHNRGSQFTYDLFPPRPPFLHYKAFSSDYLWTQSQLPPLPYFGFYCVVGCILEREPWNWTH